MPSGDVGPGSLKKGPEPSLKPSWAGGLQGLQIIVGAEATEGVVKFTRSNTRLPEKCCHKRAPGLMYGVQDCA